MKKTLLLLSFLPFFSNAQIIMTIAGSGAAGFLGEGVIATAAQLNHPDGLYVDMAGNVFIADEDNNRVRKINTTGIISTFAGDGSPSSGGDGSPASAAQLNKPVAITGDASGNIYITEFTGNKVRKVNALGIISTIAGTGIIGYTGDGAAATLAKLNGPEGLCLDAAGNLYIADGYNHAIRKISSSGIISTVAGTGAYGYNGDGIPATNAKLYDPFGISCDGAGNLYIADQDNHRIRKVNSAGIISTIAGTGTAGYSADGIAATTANLNKPTGVFFDAAGSTVYVTNKLGASVRKVDAAGTITTVAGTGVASFSGDGSMATAGQLNWPVHTYVGPSGKIFVTDCLNNRVRIILGCVHGITAQPATTSVVSGSNAVFTVTATHYIPSYQWQEDTGTGFVNLVNVLPYSGVTTNTLTVHSVTTAFSANHYRCIIGNESTCDDTTNVAILTVTSGAGITTINPNDVSIYPNPFSDVATVELHVPLVSGNVELVDAVGQIVATQQIKGSMVQFNTCEFSPGIYFMRILSSAGTINKMLIKDR